jgi:exopolysaccharide biosynthesis polyprenyl glycosylphosphotransferase
MRNQTSSNHTNGSSRHPVVKRNWRSLYVLVALIVDLLAIVFSNLFALELYRFLQPGPASDSLPAFADSTTFFASLFIFLGLLFGLYRAAYHTKIRQQYLLGARVYLYGAIAILAILFATRHTEYARLYLFFFLIAVPACFLLLRTGLHHVNTMMQHRGFGIYNAVIVEHGHSVDEVLFNRFRSFPELGYRIHTHVLKRWMGLHDDKAHITLAQLEKILEKEHIDSVFIPTLDIIENGYSELIGFCEEKNVKLKLLSKESDDLLRFAYVKDLAGISLFTPQKRKTERIKAMAKRGFDVLFSLLALSVLSPLFILVSLAILIEDGGPVFFKQRRALTKHGRAFELLKFRSMERDAERHQDGMYAKNKTTGGLFRVDDDPRVTRVGGFVRKFSIDELPQLLNVLQGDMSIVGPRPLTLSDLSNIAPENEMGGYHALREKGKPGMTGLWQISGRREIGFREMVLLDLYYLEHQTILFDMEIIAQTIPVVLFGRGGY